MFYLPLFNNLQGARCLVVGGGQTALRKLRWLIKAEAIVRVVSPDVCTEIVDLASEGTLEWIEKPFAPSDVVTGTRLVVSAANDTAVNKTVFEAAMEAGVLVNCVDDPDRCTVIFPSIVDRAPIYVAISSSATAPALARIVRGWIEAWLPRGLGELSQLAIAFREKASKRFPDLSARVNFWNRLLTGQAAGRALAGDLTGAVAAGDELIEDRREGFVSLVGCGPGDAELVTLKALRVIQTADVILYDKLINEELLEYARRDAECIYVGKQGPRPDEQARKNTRSFQQLSINELIVKHASTGAHVARLKGGDPFIYGRGGEELEAAITAGFEVEVIPGITASFGAASYTGIPLTHRDYSQSVRFVTGHRVESLVNLDWPEFVRADQTLVIYMGLVGLRQICQKMVDAGAETERPVALIENATLPDQRQFTGDLGSIADLADYEGVTGPTIVIIGDVVQAQQMVTPSVGFTTLPQG